MRRLDGKVAIITGGAQGQGAAHARRMLTEGAAVVISDINNELGHQTAREIGGKITFVQQDVTEAADWATVIKAAEEAFGRVDILVNNAAIDLQKSLEDMTEDEYRRVIEVNQNSVFLGMKAAIEPMKRAGGGSIVNISSIVGMHAVSSLRFAYAAAKFALRGMTKVASIELAQYGIRVNTVHPGFVDTPMLASATHTERLKSVPLGRAANVDEISQLVAFLASDESSYITGTEHLVDGGLSHGW
ncbi:glucose 1-dehydrogenase [Amycolatopsis sp. K13G38]|uniref:Glucose 1-dehydrogenase n=1 Tax=Amycolatopsis acididurans TaxID=2724524 RepID=A0ABX1J0P5_9PSEU|nr:glucose 1-dehydrogenase [Amycolatopsis acididurans]NKQ51935.1 glucose 1-dehydrogenase [Amycolatopsis acididurans]